MTKEEELKLLKEFAKSALPVCLDRQIKLKVDDRNVFVNENSIAEAAAEDAFHTASSMVDQYLSYKSMLEE